MIIKKTMRKNPKLADNKYLDNFREKVLPTFAAQIMSLLNVRRLECPAEFETGVSLQISVEPLVEVEPLVPREVKLLRNMVMRNLAGMFMAAGLETVELAEMTPDDVRSVRKLFLEEEESKPEVEAVTPEIVDDDKFAPASNYANNVILSAVAQLLPMVGRDFAIQDGEIIGTSSVGRNFAKALREELPEGQEITLEYVMDRMPMFDRDFIVEAVQVVGKDNSTNAFETKIRVQSFNKIGAAFAADLGKILPEFFNKRVGK